MSNLFKKAAIFTDIHYGLKSNSDQHNIDCDNFVDWFCQTAKNEGCDTCLFLGDYHHNRATINVKTLHHSLMGIEKLSANFQQVYIIVGNHDMFNKSKRDVNSLEWSKHLPNVHLIDKIFQEGDVTLCPFLIDKEFTLLKNMKSKYLFSHLELPGFMMNALVEMPDHQELQTDHLRGFETVYSGHFHKRQFRDNVIYIGNAFPHNYADAGDDARGMMILEWGQVPKFHSWPDQPRFRVHKLSEVLDNPDGLLQKGMHVRVNLDIDITYEESSFIREQLMPKHELREMSLIPMKLDIGQDDTDYANLQFESVDSIIISQIEQLQQGSFDRQLLLQIYREL